MKSPLLFITLCVVLCISISTASAAYNSGSFHGNHNPHHNWHPYNNCKTCTGNNCQACTGNNCQACSGSSGTGTGCNCINCNNCSNCNDGNCFPGCNCNCTGCGSSCPNGNSGNNDISGNGGNSGNSVNSETNPITYQPPETTSSGVTSYNPHTGNIYEVGGDGQRLVLTDYASAKDPTYQQMLDFVKSDNTDELPYTNTFVCSDFAEVLHNNAEKAGIKCAWIGCEFTNGGEGHAFNEFNTTDKGVVYIDCTGVPNPDGNQDKILSCTIGQPLTSEYLFRSNYHSVGSMGIVKDLITFW